MTTEPRHEAEPADADALAAAITAPVDHEKLRRDIRESLANPPDHSALREQLGRPRRRVA